MGISGESEGRTLLLGNHALMQAQNISTAGEADALVQSQAGKGVTPVMLAVDGNIAAILSIRDPLREDSVSALARLHKQGLPSGDADRGQRSNRPGYRQRSRD
ncbi:Copper-exporting P-type ATPase A [Morganella morganii]|nr:Copper-exporting P-type ATPase A [Morganella morganii]